MKSLLIFDCDGVLVDSEIISSRIASEMITQLGFAITPEECLRWLTGMSGQEAYKFLQKEGGITIPQDFPEQVDPLLMEAYKAELQPLMKSVLEHPLVLERARCVASNNPKRRVVKALEVTEQEHFFDVEHIFTAELVKHGKPAPELFLFALEKMGYRPEEALVIEDSLAGIEAAEKAGVEVIGFLGGTHAKHDWYEQQIVERAPQVVRDVEELIAQLEIML